MLRRLIRRAVRFAYLLGVDDLVLPRLTSTCIDSMGDAYPELPAHRDAIVGIIEREEGGFRTTLARGVTLLEESFAAHPEEVPGDLAFKLHDTYGFPVEVTQEIAAERGIGVDLAGFDRQMGEQRTRAKEAGRKGDVYANRASFQQILDDHGATEFVGREESEAKATVLAVVPGRRRHGVGLPRPHARSTPRAAARSATPAASPPTRAAPRCSTPPTPCPACTGTSSGSRARSSRARRPPRRSTSTGATPSDATTPAPTSCTGRCARCSARR